MFAGIVRCGCYLTFTTFAPDALSLAGMLAFGQPQLLLAPGEMMATVGLKMFRNAPTGILGILVVWDAR